MIVLLFRFVASVIIDNGRICCLHQHEALNEVFGGQYNYYDHCKRPNSKMDVMDTHVLLVGRGSIWIRNYSIYHGTRSNNSWTRSIPICRGRIFCDPRWKVNSQQHIFHDKSWRSLLTVRRFPRCPTHGIKGKGNIIDGKECRILIDSNLAINHILKIPIQPFWLFDCTRRRWLRRGGLFHHGQT